MKISANKAGAGPALALAPAGSVWLVLWAEQNTQRSGVHGVFKDEGIALRAAHALNGSMPAVYRAEQWPILPPNVERSHGAETPDPSTAKTPDNSKPLLADAIGSADALKVAISGIMLKALNGSEPRYRLDHYVRWGEVERDIHAAIDTALPPNK